MTAADPADAQLAAALERLAAAGRAHYQQQAERSGLTPLQIHVLLVVARAPDPPGVGDVAHHLDVAQPTVSDAITTLAGKGLLASVRSPVDARRRELRVTEQGTVTLSQITTFDALLQRLLADTAPDVKADPAAVLMDLIAALQREEVVTVARMCTTCRFFAPHRHHDTDRPHHCMLLDLPLAPAHLRIDCHEHQPVVSER